MAGLQPTQWLASRLEPWLKATDGLQQLMAASHGLQHQKWKSHNSWANKAES